MYQLCGAEGPISGEAALIIGMCPPRIAVAATVSLTIVDKLSVDLW